MLSLSWWWLLFVPTLAPCAAVGFPLLVDPTLRLADVCSLLKEAGPARMARRQRYGLDASIFVKRMFAGHRNARVALSE
jgi:hypothetical protein